MLLRVKIILIVAVISSNAYAQDINQLDANGQRHGSWQKKYEGTNKLRYTGTFDHGKEVGEFKFYDKSGGHHTAVKRYTSGITLLDVSFFTTEGKKVSEGQMEGRSRVGKWVYYHSDGESILSTEFYVDGLKQGIRTEYYVNGEKALQENYKAGKRDGLSHHFTENGDSLKELMYMNDFLHGNTKLYDALGNLIKEGSYKNNKKHGIWKYYTNGKVIKEVKFPQNKIGVEH